MDKFHLQYQTILFASEGRECSTTLTMAAAQPLRKVLLEFLHQQFLTFSNQQSEEARPPVEFEHFCVLLHKLDLISVFEGIFTDILFQQIEAKVNQDCSGNFGESLLPTMLNWLDTVVFPWLKLVVCPTSMEKNVPLNKNRFGGGYRSTINLFGVEISIRILLVRDLHSVTVNQTIVVLMIPELANYLISLSTFRPAHRVCMI